MSSEGVPFGTLGGFFALLAEMFHMVNLLNSSALLVCSNRAVIFVGHFLAVIFVPHTFFHNEIYYLRFLCTGILVVEPSNLACLALLAEMYQMVLPLD